MGMNYVLYHQVRGPQRHLSCLNLKRKGFRLTFQQEICFDATNMRTSLAIHDDINRNQSSPLLPQEHLPFVESYDLTIYRCSLSDDTCSRYFKLFGRGARLCVVWSPNSLMEQTHCVC